jgi:phi13 family phage major tail protein
MGRIKFGIKNLHYAVATDNGSGTLTYGTPAAIPGAKSLSMDAQTETLDEYADNSVWFHLDSNNGYSGTLELEDTKEAEDFLAEVLGRTVDSLTGVITEKATDTAAQFALMWEFSLAGSTETGKRGKLYRCQAGRPSIASTTKESVITVQTLSIPVTAMPRIDTDEVQASCISTDSAYATWFSAV